MTRYYVLDPGLLITQDRLGYSTASALLGIEGSPISVAQSPAIKLIPWAGQAFPGIYGVNGCLPQILPNRLPSFARDCSTVCSRQGNCRDHAGISESWIYKGDGDLYNCTFW